MSGLKIGDFIFPYKYTIVDDIVDKASSANKLILSGVVVSYDVMQGVVRIPGKILTSINNKVEANAVKQLLQLEAGLLKFQANIKLPSVAAPVELVEKDYTQMIDQMDRSLNSFTGSIELEKNMRSNFEDIHQIKPVISKKLQDKIVEYSKMAEMSREQKKAGHNKYLLNLKKIQQEDSLEYNREYNKILQICIFMKDIFPFHADELQNRLQNLQPNMRVLLRFRKRENIVLIEKMLSDPKNKDILLKTSNSLYKLRNHPFFSQMTHEEYSDLESYVEGRLQGLSHNNTPDKVFERIEGKISNSLKIIESRDQKHRIESAEIKIKDSMFNRGYEQVIKKKDDYFSYFEGTDSEGKKALIKIKTEDAGHEDDPDIELVINPEKYNSQKEWDREGQLLAKELLTQGLSFSYKESATHFKGALVQRAAESLKKELEEKYVKDNFNVHLENRDVIKVNGLSIVWRPGLAVSDVIDIYNKMTGTKVVEKEKGKRRIKN